MDDLLPYTAIHGMTDPRAWVEAVAARLPAQPPLALPAWGTYDGRPALCWDHRAGREQIGVMLTPHPAHVDLGVWSGAWGASLEADYDTYADLVTWVGQMLIYGDPEAARLRLVVQSYADAQAAREVG